MASPTAPLRWATLESRDRQEDAGLRFGDRGTHTSRTMMLRELTELLAVMPRGATQEDYGSAIVDENILGKDTSSNRRYTRQRLSELYGLDPSLPMFRVLLRLWNLDEDGRPLLALLCALARDPLLRATAVAVLPMTPGQELPPLGDGGSYCGSGGRSAERHGDGQGRP